MEQIKIELDEHNKELLRAILFNMAKANVVLQKAQLTYTSYEAQRAVLVNAIINREGHRGKKFRIDKDYNLIETPKTNQ